MAIIQPDFTELSFYHIAAKVSVSFKAYISDFKDKYTSNWDKKEVYGRMDPIGTFKGTVREITLAWTVPADSFEEAKINMYKAQTLNSMLYPMYDKRDAGFEGEEGYGIQPALIAAPLMKVKLANLIINGAFEAAHDKVSDSGLMCSVDGFMFDPEIEEGFFFQEKGNIYPQTLKFSCTLQVYHDHPVGWDSSQLSVGDGKGLRAPDNFDEIEQRKRAYPDFFPYAMGGDELAGTVRRFVEKRDNNNQEDTSNRSNLKEKNNKKILGN